jgi:hypothetical protein
MCLKPISGRSGMLADFTPVFLLRDSDLRTAAGGFAI